MKHIILTIAICSAFAFVAKDRVEKTDHKSEGQTTQMSHQNQKNMYVIRNVFTAKPGKAKDLVAVFKKAGQTDLGLNNMRVMTDIAAGFWTVVVEHEVASLDKEARDARSYTSSPEMREIFKNYLDYVESGYREIFILE